MRREIGRWRALGNVGFALAVLAVAGFGLYQMASRRWRVQPTFHVRARFATIAGLDLNDVGYGIVALFAGTWVLALAVWKYGRVEEKWEARLDAAD